MFAIVAFRFGYTCVLQLPSVCSKEASVLAHQGVQEGSGACNFFSNGYYGQVLCMWTGVAGLGAGLRHDEVAYRICNVYILRAAQMTEQRGAQSKRSQSKWTQIDGPNCTVQP